MAEAEARTCQNCKQSFVIASEDFTFYEKIQVPPPTFCSECRLQRRLAWRNERALYRRKCDKCRKGIISVFPEDSGMTVYCRPCWWADDWDGLEYGAEFDPGKPFILQLQELFKRTPVMSLFGVYHTLKDSEYVNMASYLRNCYMLFHSDESENCMYGSMVSGSKECVDNLMLNDCELCYENVNCQKCYRTRYSNDCEGCTDVWFSKNCVGCSDCFGCVNLRNQKYHIFNQPYTREDYEKQIQALGLGSRVNLAQVAEKARAFSRQFPQKFLHERHSSGVSGDYIYRSKNTRDSFVANDMEDCRFCSLVTPGGTTNAYDFTHYGMGADLMYETLQCGNQSSRIRWSWFTLAGARDVEYGMFAIGCTECFGTVGLKKRTHCILNRQYSPERYAELRQVIIAQMNETPYLDARGLPYRYGEFFPIELSPFGYNVTTAQESFPLSREEIGSRGWRYKEPERTQYDVTLTCDALPDEIAGVGDAITDEIVECGHRGACGGQCTKAYRITSAELQFYRRMNVPLPVLCPACRFDERLALRNPFRLRERTCMCEGKTTHSHGDAPCANRFQTAYASEGSAVVYCEQCYNVEVT